MTAEPTERRAMKKGWLKHQMANASREVRKWPKWKRDMIKQAHESQLSKHKASKS